MSDDISRQLSFVKSTLAEARQYEQASRIVDFDRATAAPPKARYLAGEITVSLFARSYETRHKPEFIEAAEALYAERETLDEWDRAMVETLHRQYLREKNISVERQSNYDSIKNQAWIAWLDAKEEADFSRFADELAAVRDIEVERVGLREFDGDERPRDGSAYALMIDEFEPGMTTERLDALFDECKTRLSELLHRVSESPKQIRTDFLYRKVTDAQQERAARYLLGLLGFDSDRGTFATSEHPFTNLLAPDDVRVTTHYYSHLFLSSIYSIIHECGHALFEQNQPDEDHSHFISDNKTMGMHESVSRFYENIIGRSEAFIRLIYPKLCELFPQVLADVTEAELYEAVNLVTPSLIRIEADELTYTLHIIIRYEIEKELVGGRIEVSDIPVLWNKKYGEYLGVVPENDREGVLQDVHWASDFGYFPTYALGNFYGAMYYKRMRQELDVDALIAEGDFASINAWMSEYVFSRADRLTPDEWIRDITGSEVTATDYLDYLEEKYTRLYALDRSGRYMDKNLNGYVRRMSQIRLLSSPLIDEMDTSEAYRAVLIRNFTQIGSLAQENRQLIDAMIDPLLSSDELLSEDTIEAIRGLGEALMDVDSNENIDLPIMAQLTDRLMEDAIRKNDDTYLIKQLDAQIIACVALIVQTRRILNKPEICREIRKKGLAALDRMLEYLDHDKFLALDMESRETIMINARYGDGLFLIMSPLSDEERRERMDRLRRAIGYADDPFYIEALPDYDWRYHLYRSYQYFSSYDEYDNIEGYSDEELREILYYGEKLEELCLSDPEYFSEIETYEYDHISTIRNRYHGGTLGAEEYAEELYEMYKNRIPDRYDMNAIVSNIEVPSSYCTVIGKKPINERDRARLQEMYRTAVAYVFHTPKLGLFFELMDYYAPFLFHFVEVPGGTTFEEMGLSSFAAFHPPTYIHSYMVAHISRCLTSHLMDKSPELFVGICGAEDVESVETVRGEILDYVYHAALCHDFGKLIIIDTIFVYGRKLLDFEFDLIRQHPSIGAELLERHLSTRDYVDIARGHHLWYDGTGGYPMDFDAAKSPVKTLIDIVTCADCMEAATDNAGRSYNRGKTLVEFLAELSEGAGTRYAPYLPELLSEPSVRADIEYLLGDGRADIYRQTFLLLKNVQESGH